jgi:quercetin dioxygenase-like cupin family protein
LAYTHGDAVSAQARKRVFVTRFYTGPDNQTHSEDVEVAFTTGTVADVSQLMKVTGGELRRTPPGTVLDWHPAPRRQYIIPLSGRGEVEVASGKKIPIEPGRIQLIEDTTGKGHITRVVGSEELVSIFLPLVDQASR